MSSITTAANKRSSFDGRKMWFIFAIIAAAVVAILVFSLMSIVTRTETYYTLKQDIPARTEITQNLLQEVTVSAGAVPQTALGLGDILSSSSPLYSLYPLSRNDVLTKSNIGQLLPLSEGMPSDFVIASFSAKPNISAGGNIKRGDYVDIITVADNDPITGNQGTVATYVLQHVLVVDATVDLNTYDGKASSDSSGGTTTGTSSNNASTIDQRSGIPMLYTVGLTQENALRLAVASKYDIYVVLSSRDAINGNVNENPGSISSSNIWGENAPDAGYGTDNTFGLNGDQPVLPPKPTTPSPTETPSSPDTSPSPSPSTGTDQGTGTGTGTDTGTGTNQ